MPIPLKDNHVLQVYNLNTALPESMSEGKIQEINFGQSALNQDMTFCKVALSHVTVWKCNTVYVYTARQKENEFQ